MSAEAEGRREDFMQLYKQKEEQQVELIDRILDDENIEAAIRAVQQNQGAPGIDKMPVGRNKSVKRSISRSRYGGYTSRKQTERCGRWGYRR